MCLSNVFLSMEYLHSVFFDAIIINEFFRSSSNYYCNLIFNIKNKKYKITNKIKKTLTITINKM